MLCHYWSGRNKLLKYKKYIEGYRLLNFRHMLAKLNHFESHKNMMLLLKSQEHPQII